MAKPSKRMQAIAKLVDKNRKYDIAEAIKVHQIDVPKLKFNASVEAAICLGVDAKKSDQTVRGACALPHGTGKTMRVAVFAQGDKAEVAKKAGADVVGFQDLATDIQNGEINFDILIATPDAMPMVGKLGQILGPKGLMPNPKVGTVTNDVERAVTQAKAGQVQFRTDKAGIVHVLIGKLDFKPEHLQANLEALLSTVKKLRPQTAKGVFLKKLVLSSTMGPGLEVNIGSLSF